MAVADEMMQHWQRMKGSDKETQTSFLTLFVLVAPWLVFVVWFPSPLLLLITPHLKPLRQLPTLFDHRAFISTLLSWWLFLMYFIALMLMSVFPQGRIAGGLYTPLRGLCGKELS